VLVYSDRVGYPIPSEGYYDIQTEIEGNVEEIKLNGKAIDATYSSGTLELGENVLPDKVKDMGKTTLEISTDKVKYQFNAWVVTMAIYDEEDLNKFIILADAIDSRTYYSNGFFVLANDIECKGTYS
jgi:hypothetical protein